MLTIDRAHFCIESAARKDFEVWVEKHGSQAFSTAIRQGTTKGEKSWYPGPNGAGTYTVSIVEPVPVSPRTTSPPPTLPHQPIPQLTQSAIVPAFLVGQFILVVSSPASPTVLRIRDNGQPEYELTVVARRGAHVRFDLHASTATVQTAIVSLPDAIAVQRYLPDSVPFALDPADIVERNRGSWTVTADGHVGTLLWIGFVEKDLVRFVYAIRIVR
jgi:hypothetical protein